MKKHLLLLAFPLLTAFGASAQKIAHFNRDSVLILMPETQAASAQLEVFIQQLSDRVKTMQTEHDAKVKEYNDMQAKPGTSKTVLESMLKDIQALEQRIQDFQVSAQNDIQNKRTELITPILDKINNAVKDIAKEKGYVYVIDSSKRNDFLVFTEPSLDIFPVIKKKFNLPDKVPAPATTGGGSGQ